MDCMVMQVIKISVYILCDWAFQYNSGKLETPNSLSKETKLLYNFETPDIPKWKQHNIHGLHPSMLLWHQHRVSLNVWSSFREHLIKSYKVYGDDRRQKGRWMDKIEKFPYFVLGWVLGEIFSNNLTKSFKYYFFLELFWTNTLCAIVLTTQKNCVTYNLCLRGQKQSF